MFTLAVSSFVYSYVAAERAAYDNGQKFCSIITTVNDAYRDSEEPATELGRSLKANYIQLEKDLDCRRD